MWLQSQKDRALPKLRKYLVNKCVDKNSHPAQRWEPVHSQLRIRVLSSSSCYQGYQAKSPDSLRDSVTMSPPNGACSFLVTLTLIVLHLHFSIYLIGHSWHCPCYFVEIYARVYTRRKRKMWCSLDIRDYEQPSRDRVSVASRNTTVRVLSREKGESACTHLFHFHNLSYIHYIH